MLSRLLLSAIAIVLVVGLHSSAVRATTITVDGNSDDWPSAALLATDVAGDSVSSTADFEAVYFTNDSTHMYWRFDTQSSTSWGLIQQIKICMDIDNDATNNVYPCGDETADAYVWMMPSSGHLQLERGGQGLGTNPLRMATEGRVTEVSITLADLQIPAQCNAGSTCAIPSSLRLNTLGKADSIPDTGTMPAQMPGPTNVTIKGLQAVTSNRKVSMVLPLGMIFVGASLLIQFVRVRQSRGTVLDG